MRAALERHLALIMFVILALAMSALTLNAVQGIALEPTQRAWLVASVVGLAGLVTWIISQV